jgi:hypothetical protein
MTCRQRQVRSKFVGLQVSIPLARHINSYNPSLSLILLVNLLSTLPPHPTSASVSNGKPVIRAASTWAFLFGSLFSEKFRFDAIACRCIGGRQSISEFGGILYVRHAHPKTRLSMDYRQFELDTIFPSMDEGPCLRNSHVGIYR